VTIPRRILIVEDSADDAELAVRVLRQSGMDLTYERVDTPEAMLAALEERPWDVVLSDFSICLLYTSPSPRDLSTSRMPSSA